MDIVTNLGAGPLVLGDDLFREPLYHPLSSLLPGDVPHRGNESMRVPVLVLYQARVHLPFETGAVLAQ